jgi:hypothetical protein
MLIFFQKIIKIKILHQFIYKYFLFYEDEILVYKIVLNP